MENVKHHSLFKRRYLDYYRTIHSIKTAVACIIGLSIEKYFNFPSGQWVPITIMVVMSAQTRFGGALKKAYMRFLGTFAGVLTTIATLALFGTNVPVMFLVVFIACLFFTYIASNKSDINYAGTLGGVTVLLTLTAANADIYMAAQRGLYIVLGIIIALLMSRFVLPIHARDLFRFNVANSLHNLKNLYSATIQMHIDANQQTADPGIETVLLEELSEQPRLIVEACAGSRLFASKQNTFNEIVSSERRLHRLINLMYRTICEIENPIIIKEQITAIEKIHVAIQNELENLASCFERSNQPQCSIDMIDALTTINRLVATLPKIEDANKIIAEHSFLFFMEQILKEIEALRNLISKIND
jgi:uncharacterized membrane protein YccC